MWLDILLSRFIGLLELNFYELQNKLQSGLAQYSITHKILI